LTYIEIVYYFYIIADLWLNCGRVISAAKAIKSALVFATAVFFWE